jgi:hypothetical protein
MKRVVLPLAVVLVLAGAGIYLQRHVAPHARQVATWLPATTILFEDIPDIHRTADRWPATALAQIIAEPEVQAFLERPLREIPRRADADQWMEQLRRIDPLHFFLAVTDWSGPSPNGIAGLYFSGSHDDMDGLMNQLRQQAQKTWPEGKSDIEKYGAGEIETFTTPNFSAGLAYRGQWLFIATDTAVLKATLDRYEGKADPNSLAELPAFKSSLQHLPQAPDNILFMRPALLADKAATLALMLNPTADAHAGDSLKQIDSIGMALKLDGEVMRDAAYMVRAEPGDVPPLAKDALKLSTPDTIVALDSRVQQIGTAQMPDPKGDPTGVLQLLASYLKIFADQGLGAQQLGQAFGPESGFVLDWPVGALNPTPLVMMDVREPALARKFLDTLATLPLAAGVDFTHQDEGGIALYSLPPMGMGMFSLQVTFGLTGKCVIGALNVDAVKQAAKRWDAQSAGLAGTEAYKKASALVEEPTTSFTYVDAKAVFDRVYGLFRGVASMGFVPHLSDYVDIAKLPQGDTISRHLGPIVASSAVTDGGLLMQSVGPVTTTQATVGTLIVVGAAALPFVEQQIKGQNVTIPGMPGLSPKGPGPAQNPFTSPWSQGSSAIPSAPVASPAPSFPAPAASPSGGTP